MPPGLTTKRARVKNDFIYSIEQGRQHYAVGENGEIDGKGNQHEVLLDRGLTYKVIDRDEIKTTYKHPNLRNEISFRIHKLIVEVVPSKKKNT